MHAAVRSHEPGGESIEHLLWVGLNTVGIGHQRPIMAAVAILGTYGVVYFGTSYAIRVEECAVALRRVARLRRR